MRISLELIQFQVSRLNTDVTKVNAGHTVMALIECGVGQIRNQDREPDHVVLIQIVIHIITNVRVHAVFDLKKN